MSPEARAVLWRVTLAALAAAALFALGRSGDSWAVMVLGPLVVTGVLAFAVRRPLEAYRAARGPLDPEVIALLKRHVPHFNGLDAAGQEAFARRVTRLVLFSERALRDGWNHDSDGYNVSVHEWAHVLDLEDGFADGIPGLAPGSLAEEQQMLNHELVRVRGGRSVLRDYAGTNRAELFAVATEVFFERPELLRRSHSTLYDVLSAWLRVDPVELLRKAGVAPTPVRQAGKRAQGKRKGGKKARVR
ncbi:MAG: zinc-dependent peptidase [Sandaracinaceae bacterium]|nr:zinc-dependent peptidase [Sandaracinaceae bacterium]